MDQARRPLPTTRAKKFIPIWHWLLGLIALAAIAALVVVPLVLGLGTASLPARVSAMLRSIQVAQKDFREHDRARSGKEVYWRADIAGLYALPGGDGQPIKLIPLGIAAADDRPVVDLSPFAVRSPCAGYWYRALRVEGEREPAGDRFATCAFADSLDVDAYAYLITQDGVVFRKRRIAHEDRPDVCPVDPLKSGWEKTN